jgi:glyoxylase-like metal-dependent hydrolase (beta-lactamase superfamily II)
VATRDASGEWAPTFPNARLMLGRVDYDYYLELRDAPEDERPNGFVYPDPDCDPSLPRQMKLVWEETLRPVVEAGLLDLLPTGSQIVEGVSYVSTPGHTRGHQSVTIESEGQRAFITGDFIHHPMQIAHPDWSSGGDWDADASAKNRRDFFESCAGTDLLILGSHFTGMGAGYIVEDGDAFRLVATAPSS